MKVAARVGLIAASVVWANVAFVAAPYALILAFDQSPTRGDAALLFAIYLAAPLTIAALWSVQLRGKYPLATQARAAAWFIGIVMTLSAVGISIITVLNLTNG